LFNKYLSKKHRFYLIVVLIIIIIIFTACSKEKNTSQKEKLKIGISMISLDTDTNRLIKEGILDNHENIELYWKTAEKDKEKQNRDIEDLLKKNLDVMIVQMVDPRSSKIIKKITDKKIPVVAMDRLPVNIKTDAFVSFDYFQAGILQMKYIADQIEHKGNILILNKDKKLNTSLDTHEGIQTILKEEKNIKLIAEEYIDNMSKELTKNTLGKHLNSDNKIDAIITMNSDMTISVVSMLEKKNLNKKIVSIGCCASKEVTRAIIEEKLNSSIDKMPYLMGLYSIKIAKLITEKKDWNFDQIIKNGEYKIPVKIVPVLLIDKYNIPRLTERYKELKSLIKTQPSIKVKPKHEE